MLRKLLVCLGMTVVLIVLAILYSARIPREQHDADEVFASVANELRAMQEGETIRATDGSHE